MKAVLVINVPEDFDYRRCSIGGDGNIYYEREGEQRASIVGNIKNLRPLPQKKHDGLVFKSDGTAFTQEMEIGWNAYRDAITGGTDYCDSVEE